MPKVFEKEGFKFFFFSNEGNPLEPCHIHVRKGESLAKIWLEPYINLESSYCFNSKELRFITQEVINNKNLIRRKWNDYFNA